MATKPTNAGQEPLELQGVDSSRPVGSVEREVRAAVKAAELEARDGGAAEAAAALARGMDLALARRDPYAVAALGKPLTEQLSRLHLDPEARGQERKAGPADPWDALVEELAGELKGGGAHGADHGRPAR